MMIAEACILFGWSSDDCLNMPASRFFRLVDAGRRIKQVRHAFFMADLVDVASIPLANAKYSEFVKNSFLKRIVDIDGPVAVGPEPKKPGLDGEAARSNVFALFGSAKG